MTSWQMKRCTLTSILLVLAALLFVFFPQQFSDAGAAAGQRRKLSPIARPRSAAKATSNYSKFLHATKAHQEACSACHQAPTSNWQNVRDFPDVADFPDHNACVRCHRPQFFKGAQPVICTVCHTKTSPRNDARLSFPSPSRPQQFTIEFPHDKHQDVIAELRPSSKALEFSKVSWWKSAHATSSADDPVKKYNNCEICHATNTTPPVAPAAGWTDKFVPEPDTYKSVPQNHASCFNCHWRGQEPTKDNCAGCHKLAASPYPASATPNRKSIKFRHDGGGDKKNHPAECTTCHINITRASTLKGLKPDVPIAPSCAASSCHQPVIAEELSKFNKAPGSFTCVKCHTSEVGSRKPPNSHELAAIGQ
jgi:hypothetical protein